jgi:RHS repeat-associated protein
MDCGYLTQLSVSSATILELSMMAIKTSSCSKARSDSISEQLSNQKITYTYDSMNRRVARTDEKGTTQYLYGNPNHPFQLTAVRSPSGSLSRYHYDDFGLLFALERDNNWYYITTDQLGTPRVVCDANGELVKVLEYDSFGQVIADRNPEFELHISFAGGLIDVDTELVRFGFRDYDTVAGKWTAKDPIGFAGGDGNLYGYVVNTPINLADPLGLEPQEVVLYGGIVDHNPAIYEAAINYRGSSTTAGPSGGRKACAWSVNNVLRNAGLGVIGKNSNLVNSVEADLLAGRGTLILDSSNARAGDIAIMPGQHIGICITDGCTRVLSNSSSKATFKWESGTNFDGAYGKDATSRIYRVVN